MRTATTQQAALRTLPVLLACQHILFFKPPLPLVGQSLYCRRCDGYAVVTSPVRWNER